MNAKNSTYDKYNKIGDSKFSWQKECSENIRNQQNVILSSPTGSGKTKVFLEWAQNKQIKPIIITAPIKALSNQRYRELLDAGYTVGLETGDIKNVPDNCDFICCTQEIYTNKYSKLEDVTLIMDEFHYIFENSQRARTYVDALHNSKAKNILLCSATLGDISKLTGYVNKVSGRDFFAYENNSRSTSLIFEGDIDYEGIKNSLIVTFSKRNIENILSLLYQSRELQDEGIIEAIDKLAEEDKIDNYEIIDNARKGISGYYSALMPKEKLFIEKCFEQGMIDTVVGTDALALGVNFPVENVIFAQLAKYYEGPISKNLFDQLAGRAGRKGFFDEGHVYYCTDFANFCEAWEYDTQKLFEAILEQQNEDVSISLTYNVKSILLERTTIEEEAEFISRFSTAEVDVDNTNKEISNIVDYIRNKAFEEEVNRIVYEGQDDEYDYDDYDYDDEYENEEDYKSKSEYKRYKERIGPIERLLELTPESVALYPDGCYYSAFSRVLEIIENQKSLFDIEYSNDLYKCLQTFTNNGYLEGGVKLSESEKFTDAHISNVLPVLNYIFEHKENILKDIEERKERFSKFIQEDEEKNRIYEEQKRRKEEERKAKQIKEEELLSKKEEFSQNIARVYFDEYSPEVNCKIFTEILCGIDSREILQEYGISGNFNEMLQFRKYVRSLPTKYRKGLTEINDIIREFDETAIDGFRGSVSVEQITGKLEQEGKLESRNVMQVLKDQERMQRMNDRVDIIEKQLKIAEQYGWEEY